MEIKIDSSDKSNVQLIFEQVDSDVFELFEHFARSIRDGESVMHLHLMVDDNELTLKIFKKKEKNKKKYSSESNVIQFPKK